MQKAKIIVALAANNKTNRPTIYITMSLSICFHGTILGRKLGNQIA